MNFTSERVSLLILGVLSLFCARGLFVFFDDPEGPNLLVVTVTALVLYFLSLAVWLRSHLVSGPKKLLLAIFAQIIITVCLYLLLNIF